MIDRPTPLTKRPSDGDRRALDSLFEYASSFSFSNLFGLGGKGEPSEGTGTQVADATRADAAKTKHQGRLTDDRSTDATTGGTATGTSDDRVRVAALGESGSAFDAIGRLAERFASGPLTRDTADRSAAAASDRDEPAAADRLAAFIDEQAGPDTAPMLSQEAKRKGWVSAPAYDEEHPDELHYRPFALGPLLTASASPDDPLLARMVEPDPVATLAMLDDELSALPMRFTPRQEVAAAMWTNQFTGDAVNFGFLPDELARAKRPDSSRPLTPRAVRTSAK